jgi:hypothetical protein
MQLLKLKGSSKRITVLVFCLIVMTQVAPLLVHAQNLRTARKRNASVWGISQTAEELCWFRIKTASSWSGNRKEFQH